MIKDLDGEQKEIIVIPDDKLPDDQLFLDGKIKVLFDRILARRKAKWDAALRARPTSKRTVVQFTTENKLAEDLGILEVDCLGEYIADEVHCFIVRYADSKYACEIFKRTDYGLGDSLESFYRGNGTTLLMGLFKDYPNSELLRLKTDFEDAQGEIAQELKKEIIEKKRGRPRKFDSIEAV